MKMPIFLVVSTLTLAACGRERPLPPVMSIQQLSGSGNLCSYKDCYFNGGQLVTYRDRTKVITAFAQSAGRDASTSTWYVPYHRNRAFFYVMRSAYKNIYLEYTRHPEGLALKEDTTNNGADGNDPVIFRPSVH